jgi:hypothetical protein
MAPFPGFDPHRHRMSPPERRANIRAYEDDCKFFDQHPLRLTRVRPAIDGEVEHLEPGKRCFAIVRQRRPGTHHRIFVYLNAGSMPDFSSECFAAELFDMFLEDDQRSALEALKQHETARLLAGAVPKGRA